MSSMRQNYLYAANNLSQNSLVADRIAIWVKIFATWTEYSFEQVKSFHSHVHKPEKYMLPRLFTAPSPKIAVALMILNTNEWYGLEMNNWMPKKGVWISMIVLRMFFMEFFKYRVSFECSIQREDSLRHAIFFANTFLIFIVPDVGISSLCM